MALGLVGKDTVGGARSVGMSALATWRRFVLYLMEQLARWLLAINWDM